MLLGGGQAETVEIAGGSIVRIPSILGVLLLSICAATAGTTARAAELVMVEEDGCVWCARWREEVGVVYDKTPEGRRAPLRRIDIHDPLPDDLTFESRPRYTPTFALFEDGREIGRIEGYPGEDFFWGLLGELLEKLPEPAAPVSTIQSREEGRGRGIGDSSEG